MPRYDYICPEGHTTERIVPLSAAPGPKRIKCQTVVETMKRTGQPDKICRLQAKRVEVYTPAVSGTPTRAAF